MADLRVIPRELHHSSRRHFLGIRQNLKRGSRRKSERLSVQDVWGGEERRKILGCLRGAVDELLRAPHPASPPHIQRGLVRCV
eukprot:3703726-Rhodomonas_salina.5